MGAVETLIVWENLDVTRYVLKDSQGVDHVIHVTKIQEKDRTLFLDKDTGTEMESIEAKPLLEWLADKYKDFGI